MTSDKEPADTVCEQGPGSDDDLEYRVESCSEPLKTTIDRAWREI
jgi:hypothetical protein